MGRRGEKEGPYERCWENLRLRTRSLVTCGKSREKEEKEGARCETKTYL